MFDVTQWDDIHISRTITFKCKLKVLFVLCIWNVGIQQTTTETIEIATTKSWEVHEKGIRNKLRLTEVVLRSRAKQESLLPTRIDKNGWNFMDQHI